MPGSAEHGDPDDLRDRAQSHDDTVDPGDCPGVPAWPTVRLYPHAVSRVAKTVVPANPKD